MSAGFSLNPQLMTTVLLSLIRPDGSVAGDSFGETDTRFSYILIQSLTLLGRMSVLDEPPLSVKRDEDEGGSSRKEGTARERILKNIQGSMNFDAGFGTEPGAESHGGQGESLGSIHNNQLFIQ